MNEERRIMVEEVDAVAPPPKARVDDAAPPRETFERTGFTGTLDAEGDSFAKLLAALSPGIGEEIEHVTLRVSAEE